MTQEGAGALAPRPNHGPSANPITDASSPRNAGDGRFYLLLRMFQVDQVPCQVLLVGREVEVAVAAEVEENGLLLSGLLGFERQVYSGFDGVCHLRCWHDAFRAGESYPRFEGGVLGVGAGLDEAFVY